jgi:hypothetical protein
VRRVVKGTVREVERVGLILEVNTNGEASKTGSRDYPSIFRRPLLRRPLSGEYGKTKNKRQRELNILFPIGFLT